MKNFLLFISLLFFCINSNAQKNKSFEGVINYKIDYVSLNSKSINEFLGDSAVVYMKKGNYKQEYPNSEEIEKVVYRSKENIYYTFNKKSNKYSTKDMCVKGDKLISVTKGDTTVNILDYPCKSIQFNFKNKTVVYYYTDSLYMNPSYFEKHINSVYNEYLKETNSIYLKIVITNSRYSLIMTAKELKQKKVRKKEFKL